MGIGSESYSIGKIGFAYHELRGGLGSIRVRIRGWKAGQFGLAVGEVGGVGVAGIEE